MERKISQKFFLTMPAIINVVWLNRRETTRARKQELHDLVCSYVFQLTYYEKLIPHYREREQSKQTKNI